MTRKSNGEHVASKRIPPVRRSLYWTLALAIVVKLAERFGKPMSPEESQQMSKIIVVLVGLVLLASAFKFFWS